MPGGTEIMDPDDVELGFALNQQTQPEKEIFVQEYYFFQAIEVERTVIDLQNGDDVFRGDPEFKFLNVDSEWGIDPGDLEQRGRAVPGRRDQCPIRCRHSGI